MLLTNFAKVHVHNLAPFKVFVEEVADAVLCLSDGREELLLGDFSVIAVAEDFVHLLFFLLGSDLSHSLFGHLAQNAFFLSVEQLVKFVVVNLALFLLFDLEARHVHFSFFLCLVVLLRLVLDGLLQNHFLENLASHCHVTLCLH